MRERLYRLLLGQIARSAKDDDDGVVLELQGPASSKLSQRIAFRSSRGAVAGAGMELATAPREPKIMVGETVTYDAGLWSMVTGRELDVKS